MIFKGTISTERLSIRTLRPGDVTRDYVRGLNDPEVNKYLVEARLKKQTLSAVRSFVRDNLDSRDSLLFGVFACGKRLIGTVRLSKVSVFHRLCSIGICIFDRMYWGQGCGLEALKAVKDLAFNDMGLHYIEAGVYAGNKASLTLFKRAGFKVDCVFKDKYRRGCGFEKVYLFGAVNRRFKMKSIR